MTRFGLFRFATADYALPLLQLRKIVHQWRGYRLPLLPATVSEVLVEGDRLVPLVNLPGVARADLPMIRNAAYKVLVDSEAGVVAFPADVTCGIVAEQKGEVSADAEEEAGTNGIFKYQGQEYHILDIDFLALRVAQES